MDKKKKGLADSQDGDFILNESGTSVSNPWNAEESLSDDKTSREDEEENKNSGTIRKQPPENDQVS